MIIVASIFCMKCVTAQDYNTARIFAHNDYARAHPFHTAYDLQVGYIEADIFLINGEILVAHHKHEIKNQNTLENLYLKPLQTKIRKNNGLVYAARGDTLTLMIDLKTEGPQTLKALITQLENYPDIIACPALQIMISGNVPDPAEWEHYPAYIFFDGRPGKPYTAAQLKRISMISTNFRSHVTWNGKDKISNADRKKILSIVDEVHAKGKKMRFWATPDSEHAWKELMDLKMDVIVTDKVEALATFLRQKK